MSKSFSNIEKWTDDEIINYLKVPRMDGRITDPSEMHLMKHLMIRIFQKLKEIEAK